MSEQNVSVLVRVLDEIDPDRCSSIVQALRAQSGVGRATAGHRSTRLLLVDYDPSATNTGRILATVRGRGLDARLIGL